MANSVVKIDFRPYVGKIRYAARDKVVRSISAPGVKTEIYTALYDTIVDKIPVDTGALAASPMAEGSAIDFGPSTKKGSTNHRFANGNITDSGIEFNPYSVSNKTGKVYYYANRVKSFRPYAWLNTDRPESTLNAVRDIIVREANNRD